MYFLNEDVRKDHESPLTRAELETIVSFGYLSGRSTM